MHGLIEIRNTDDGELVRINGTYTDRLQHGAFAALKLLNMFADKIAASGDAGYSYSEPLQAVLPKKKRPLHPGYLETTDMAPLELRGTR